MQRAYWTGAGAGLALCVACTETHDPQLPNLEPDSSLSAANIPTTQDAGVSVQTTPDSGAPAPTTGGTVLVPTARGPTGGGSADAAPAASAPTVGSVGGTGNLGAGNTPGGVFGFPAETGGIPGGGIGSPPWGSCALDGMAFSRSWVVDDRTFVISTAEQPCGAPASEAKGNGCQFELSYVTYQVPSLRKPGIYRVGADASIVIERRFPRSLNEQECTCTALPPIDTPQALTEGTIEIKSYDTRGLIVKIMAQGSGLETLIGSCPPAPAMR